MNAAEVCTRNKSTSLEDMICPLCTGRLDNSSTSLGSKNSFFADITHDTVERTIITNKNTHKNDSLAPATSDILLMIPLKTNHSTATKQPINKTVKTADIILSENFALPENISLKSFNSKFSMAYSPYVSMNNLPSCNLRLGSLFKSYKAATTPLFTMATLSQIRLTSSMLCDVTNTVLP